MPSHRSSPVVATLVAIALCTVATRASQDGIAAREGTRTQLESVAKHNMEAAAAEMLAEEEQNENMLHREEISQRGHGDLGESSEPDDDDPPPPWVEDQKKEQQKEQTRAAEARIESAMRQYDHSSEPEVPSPRHMDRSRQVHRDVEQDDDQGDLGESASVGVHAQSRDTLRAQAQNRDANTLTSAALADARAETKMHEKAAAIRRAKQIADKVRKLVKSQQHLETYSGQKVKGSVLGEAQDEQTKAIQMTAQDEVLARKMEDEQAQQTMQHLIDSERAQQRKSFEKERETTRDLLHSVREKLSLEQTKLVKSVRTETSQAVENVEKRLSDSSLAQTIEDIVKKKLAKRLSELKTAGERTVHDVSSQLNQLKHRVRRLRRQQTRMKMAESAMEQNLSHESRSRDLGESQSVQGSSLTSELEKMRLEQMMTQMRQVQPPPQIVPQPQNSEEHYELLRLKDEMQDMKKQNMLLQQLVAQRSTPPPRYTHNYLQKYFQRRHHNNAALLHKQVAMEKEQGSVNPDSTDGLEPQMLVQLAEGAEEAESASAMPLYNQRMEQARIESEDLNQRALADTLASQHFGE